ncbi:MAG: hypothetical protein WDM87_00710 [Terracidiphilus sp.]
MLLKFDYGLDEPGSAATGEAAGGSSGLLRRRLDQPYGRARPNPGEHVGQCKRKHDDIGVSQHDVGHDRQQHQQLEGMAAGKIDFLSDQKRQVLTIRKAVRPTRISQGTATHHSSTG